MLAQFTTLDATDSRIDAADLPRHWKQAINILAARGGGFAVIARGSKRPTRKAWNQAQNAIDATQARRHIDAGDNITLLAGTGNLYAFDFDADASRGYECHHLSDGLYIYRENAPHKAKFVFQCPDPIPTRTKSQQQGIDLLGVNANGTHWSCVVAGTHATGAPILWGGHTVPVLPAATVAALWEEWTGEELFAPSQAGDYQPDPTYATADLARVADALKVVDPDDMDYNAWIGCLAALHNAWGDEALPLAVAWGNGKRGEVEAKWRTFDREYTGKPATLDSIFYRARKAGWQDTWLQDQFALYRLWLASPEAIEELKAAGFRNAEQARKLLDTILQNCEERRSLRIAPGYAYLSKGSTVALGGLSRYLARLFTGGFINLQPGQKGGEATAIELVLHNVNSNKADGDANSVLHNVNRYITNGNTIHVVQNWNIYREYRDSELFMNNHYAYSSTRTQADLPTLGANGLGALLALVDGPKTTGGAAAAAGYSYGAMARTLRRYAEHDVVGVAVGERNRKTYTLKEGWRDILKDNLPRVPTYGVQLVRHAAALKSREAILTFKGEDAKAEKAGVQRERLDTLLQQVKAEAGIVPFVRPERQDKDQERRRRLVRAFVMGERAEHRPKLRKATAADQWRRREYATDIAAAGYEWAELNAWATLEHGDGWWVHRDMTEILGQYRVFNIVIDSVPTVRWVGSEVPA
jgi:DNA-binding PadR family transcriptional regulator